MDYSEAFEKLCKVKSLISEALILLDEVKDSAQFSDGNSLELTLMGLVQESTTPHQLARKLFPFD